MEVYTVKLSSKEFTQMRVALAIANKLIVEKQNEAQVAGDEEKVLALEITRMQNDSCHLALDGAKMEDLDNG